MTITFEPFGLDTVSKRKYTLKMWDEVIEKEVNLAETKFRVLVRGWEKPPKVDRRKPYTEGDDRVGHVGALRRTKNNIIFSAISWGSGPRPIVSSSQMWFRPGYIPGTRRGSFGSSKYKRSGEWIKAFWHHNSQVSIIRNHKISPRRFDESIAKNRNLVFAKFGRENMERIAFLLFK